MIFSWVGVGTTEYKPLTDNQQLAMSTLKELCVLTGLESIHIETWRSRFYEKNTADKHNTKQKAFERSSKELVHRRLIAADGDYYAIPDTQTQPDTR